MLIETGKGFDYTFADFNKWAKAVGFISTKIIQLAGPPSAQPSLSNKTATNKVAVARNNMWERIFLDNFN